MSSFHDVYDRRRHSDFQRDERLVLAQASRSRLVQRRQGLVLGNLADHESVSLTRLLSAFAQFETAPATAVSATSAQDSPRQSYFQQKAVYGLCQLVLLGVGLWKCHNMGLLPTHESDWLAFRPRAEWMDAGAWKGEPFTGRI